MYHEPSFPRPGSLAELLDDTPSTPPQRRTPSSPRASRFAAAALALGCVGEGCATTQHLDSGEMYTQEAASSRRNVHRVPSHREELENHTNALRFAWENMPQDVTDGLRTITSAIQRQSPDSPAVSAFTRLPQTLDLAESFHESWQTGHGDQFPTESLEVIDDLNRSIENIRHDSQTAMDITRAVWTSLRSRQITPGVARLILHRFIHPNLETYRLQAQRENPHAASIVDEDNRFVLRLADVLSDSELRLLEEFVRVRANLSSLENPPIDIRADGTTFIEFEVLERLHHTIIASDGAFSRRIWNQILQNHSRQQPTREESDTFLRAATIIEAKLVMLGMIFCGTNAPELSSTETDRLRYRSHTQAAHETHDRSDATYSSASATMRAAQDYDRPRGYTVPTTRSISRGQRTGIERTIDAAEHYDPPRGAETDGEYEGSETQRQNLAQLRELEQRYPLPGNQNTGHGTSHHSHGHHHHHRP